MPSRRALSAVVAFGGGQSYRFKHLSAPIAPGWAAVTAGKRYRFEGTQGEAAYVSVLSADPPLSEPVLVRSVAHWEATGEVLPAPRPERSGVEDLFGEGFARAE